MPDANNPADNPDVPAPRPTTPLPPESGMLPTFPESRSDALPTSPGMPSGMLPAEAQAPILPPWQMPGGPPPMPGASAPATTAPAVRGLARPLPFWARITGTALIIAALVAVFILREAQGNDWADGVWYAALAAAAIAGLVLLATAVRMLAGLAARTNPRRGRQLASASVLLGVLLVFAGEGIAFQAPVHHLHGFVLEHTQQWGSALTQFQLAGQRAPDSRDLARTYAEWGEQLSAAHQYDQAITKFDVVLHDYKLAGPEVQRAQTDEIAAYFAWGAQATGKQDYSNATAHYDALLMQPFCTGDCQRNASALDATAYYSLAEASLSQQNYDTAVSAFNTIQTRFGDSPEAQKIHADYAKALLGLGKEERQTSPCSSAIATYQNLIQNFADTPEGQQAAIDYKAPEPVTGQFTGRLAYLGGAPVAFLVKGLYVGIPSAQFFQLVNRSPFALIQPDGSFTFSPLRQGSYDLVFGSVDSAGNAVLAYVSDPSTGRLLYIADVGPLCGYDFGMIPLDVPLN